MGRDKIFKNGVRTEMGELTFFRKIEEGHQSSRTLSN